MDPSKWNYLECYYGLSGDVTGAPLQGSTSVAPEFQADQGTQGADANAIGNPARASQQVCGQSSTSSIKYTTNVTDLTADTSAIYGVRAREYDGIADNRHHIGYIAEELEAVDTRFTWKNPDGTPEGIEWFNMVVYLVEEVKKLKQQVQTLVQAQSGAQ